MEIGFYGIINGNVVIVLMTESVDWWWYAVSETEWQNYFTDMETIVSQNKVIDFLNDEDNSTVGVSCAGFTSVEKAIENYFNE